MYTQIEKPKDNINQSVNITVSQKLSGRESTFQFGDNQPEAITQRRLKEVASNSPKIKQLRALQKMLNSRPPANQSTQVESVPDNYFANVVQKEAIDQKEEIDDELSPGNTLPPSNNHVQMEENNTGLPDKLKSRIENLSGYSMDDVKVYRNSNQPAQFQAHAYTQGTDIHLGPGQEKHLPHEAWHVVQQMQGRVQPMRQAKRVSINDDPALENEADVMGKQTSTQKSYNMFPALQGKSVTNGSGLKLPSVASESLTGPSSTRQLRCNVLQRVKVNPAGNFGTYVNGTVVNASVTAGVHPDDAEVSTESIYNAQSQPVNSYGWADLLGAFQMTGAGLGALKTRYHLSIRSTSTGNNLTRMHLIHHRLGKNANKNIDNIVLGHPGFNSYHKNHVELFMGDSMDDNFYYSTGMSLNTALVAGDAIDIAPPAHANAGQPYVVGNPPTFPASLIDHTIGVLAANNGVPANAHAITTNEDVLDDHVVLWYQVIPVFGLAAATLAGNATTEVMDVYNNCRGGAVVFGEAMPAVNIGGGLTLLAMCGALAGIFPTALRVKASFYIPDPESIPLGGGATADQLPWRENRIPGRTLNNPAGNPYARIRMQYDGGMGVYTTVTRVRQL